MLRIVLSDDLRKIRFKLRDYDPTTGIETATDLTGCTAQAKYDIDGGTEKVRNLTVVNPPGTDGLLDLQSDSTMWDAVGVAEGRIYVTSGSYTAPSPGKFQIRVVAK